MEEEEEEGGTGGETERDGVSWEVNISPHDISLRITQVK